MKTEEELELILDNRNEYEGYSYRGLPFTTTILSNTSEQGYIAVRIQIYEPTPQEDSRDESYKLYIKLGCDSREFTYSRQRGLETLNDVFEEIRITLIEINTALNTNINIAEWEA